MRESKGGADQLGMPYEKDFDGYYPNWDICGGCGQRMVWQNGKTGFNQWGFKFLKHPAKGGAGTGRQTHDLVISKKIERDALRDKARRNAVSRCRDCGSPCNVDEPLCWSCECGG